jgi:hypothetical protein
MESVREAVAKLQEAWPHIVQETRLAPGFRAILPGYGVSLPEGLCECPSWAARYECKDADHESCVGAFQKARFAET